MWLNHKKLSISNLEAQLKIFLCFSVNEQLVVSWQLQFSLDEIKWIFFYPVFGKRTGGLAGSMLSLNPV